MTIPSNAEHSRVMRALEGGKVTDYDLSRAGELAHDVYGYDSASYRSYLDWKWRKNPHGSFVGFCEENNRIIGCGAYTLLPMIIDGVTKRCAIATDLMVHPEFRRQKIFLDMGQYIAQRTVGVSMAYMIGVEASRIGSMKYFQFKLLGDVPILKKYISPLSAAYHLWSYFKGPFTRDGLRYLARLAELIVITLSGALASLRFNLGQVSGSSLRGQEGVRVQELKPAVFGEEFDKLWEKLSGSFTVAVVRNREYLKWRYSNPRSVYVVLRADQQGSLVGYCVLSYTSRGKLKIAWLVDLLGTGDEVEFTLLKESHQRARDDGAHAMIMWNSKRTERSCKSLGLKRAWLSPNGLTVNILDRDIREDTVNDISNWYLTVADTADWI